MDKDMPIFYSDKKLFLKAHFIIYGEFLPLTLPITVSI